MVTGPVRVCLDLTPLVSVRTGVDRYLVDLVRGMAELGFPQLELTIVVNSLDRQVISGIVGDGAEIVEAGRGGRFGRVWTMGVLLPRLISGRRFDVVHSPSFLLPPVRAGAHHMVTVFDMTMHTRPQVHTMLRRSRAFRAAVAASIRRADLVAVPSRFVRAELLRVLPDVLAHRVRPIPLGIGPEFSPSHSASPPSTDEAPYILFVGTVEPRKNVPNLVEAYHRSVAAADLPHRLVLVGNAGPGYRSVSKVVAASGLEDRVISEGFVSDERLVELYRGATVFVYPSVEEGFGYPPLEAMACGTPVIAGDTSSLAENLSGAARLVHPGDVEGLGRAMVELCSNPRLRDELREAGLRRAAEFSITGTARSTMDCYRDLSASGGGCRRDP